MDVNAGKHDHRSHIFSGLENHRDPEVWDKVTGRAVYGIDLEFPGMLYGKILRSPHPHARIKSIDSSRAEAVPGVRAVLTAEDIRCKKYGIVVKDEFPLAHEKVRYIGDEVACVAAVDPGTAEYAAALIQVEYEPLPAVYDPEKALLDDAPQLHDDFPGNIAWERDLIRGDPERAFREADFFVEDTFSVPSVHPTYLEPIACVAISRPGVGLDLHTALQSPDVVRSLLADVLGLSLSRVRVSGPVMGGGFGGRVYGNLKLYLLSALLSMHTGLPVKMQLTREEEFTVGRPLIAAKIKMKMALNRDGKIIAREADIFTDNGAYSAQAPWVSKTLSERNDSLYRIPHIKTKARLVYTNKVPTAQYRAYGNQAANFACESLLDQAAQKIGIDPLELRLKNCTQSGDTTVHGLQIKSCALEDCLERAAKEIGWFEKNKDRGYGISAGIHANGSLVANKDFRGASARAVLELDGQVTVYTGEQDYGQGAHTAFARIAANVLGLEPEKVSIQSRDTLLTPYSQGALAMRQTTVGGRAIQLAAEELKRAIEQKASEITGEKNEMDAGQLMSTAGVTTGLEEVAHYYHHETSGLTLYGEGKFVPPPAAYDQSSYGNISLTYSFAAHAAEVSVDQNTGALIVHRSVAVHDSGRIVNYIAARGQVCGGVTQGLGMSCHESYIFENGRVVNASLADYRIPTSLDVPEIDCHFIEKADPEGPFGAKGLGEIVMVPVLGAVANAVFDATGIQVTNLPITAEKIYQALSREGC